MHNRNPYQKIAQLYLSFVPPVTAILGFTLHSVSPKIYLPLWIINIFLMLASCWVIGGNCIAQNNKMKKQVAAGGLLLIFPWILYSVFAGMGSPPETYAEWVRLAFEQQFRYSLLIAGGISLLLGFAVLRDILKNTEGNLVSLTGITVLAIATILFILNMSYWHSFLLEVFKTSEASLSNKLPEWHQPAKKFFLVISIVEVSLMYLGTAAFAASLKSAGWFKTSASRIYIFTGLLAFVLVASYGLYPDAVITNGFPFYPFMIPAIPFVIPYYIGINLLKHIKVSTIESSKTISEI